MSKVPQVQLERAVLQAQLEHKAPLVLQELQVFKEQQDLREQLEDRVLQVQRERPEQVAHLVRKELLVQLV